MKKIILIGLIFGLFLIPFVSALSVQPPAIERDYVLGDDQPESMIINFSNLVENTDVSVTLSEEGGTMDFIEVSPTSFTLINISTQIVTASFNIPPTTTPQLYSGKIKYLDTYLPVYINVKPAQTVGQCRIISTFSEYAMSIKKGSPSFQNTYNFKISKYCTEGVDITDIYPSGQITMTDSGYGPIRVTGGIPKDFKEPDESFQVTLEFDSTELSMGTYVTYLILGGIAEDETITSIIKFTITVVGEATPVGDVITQPVFDPIPVELTLNNSYILVARSVNPNIQIRVEPNEFLKGEYTEMSDSTWRWHFSPLEIGNTVIRMWAEYLGGIIGEIQEQEVRITSVTPPAGGINLSFQFFPSLEELQDGSTLTVLVVDAKTKSVPTNFNLYLNGVELESNSFNVSVGKEYNLRGTVPGYLDVEKTFNITVQQKSITISFSPSSPKIGDNVSITTNPANASLFLDGSAIGNSFVKNTEGNFTIKATLDGYVDTEKSVMIVTGLSLTYVPVLEDTDQDGYAELKKDENYIIEWNQPTNSYIMFKEKGSDEYITLVESSTNKIEFSPEKPGTYIVNSNGIDYKYYELQGSDWFGWAKRNWLWIGIMVAIIAVYFFFRSHSGKPKEQMVMNLGESE